jgi:hypothetical protein
MPVRMKRQRFTAGVRQDEVWSAYELRWPRYDYEIASEPKDLGKMRLDAVTGEPTDRMQLLSFYTRKQAERRGGLPSKRIRRLLTAVGGIRWPQGGVFIPKNYANERMPEPRDRYDPLDVAKDIILDAQRVSNTGLETVVRFVNKWGVLGVGIPGVERFPFDGVRLTRHWIQRLSRWLQALEELQKGPGARLTWAGLAEELNPVLGGVHPGLRVTDQGVDPIYRVSRLLDALCLEIWEQATAGMQLRRCPECRALFLPGRSNQRYCGRLCANRPTVRNAKRRRRERLAHPP